MKLTLTTLAVLTAFTASASAVELDFYGKANVTYQSNDDTKDKDGEVGSFTELQSNASRIGVKGNHKIDDDLEVVFKVEYEVDLDGDNASDETFKSRNHYVGLKGRFGEILAGKNDTVFKQSQGKVDLFSDLEADIKYLWVGENRSKNTLTYFSPSFNGFKAGVTFISSEDVETDDSQSFAIFYGDKKLKKSKFYAAVAFDSDVTGQSKDKSVDKVAHDATRVTLSTKLAGVTLGAMYQTQESETGQEMDGMFVSAKYGIDKWTLKAQVQTADHKDSVDRKGYTLGADYKLSSQAKLFAFYTTFKDIGSYDPEFLAVGLEYKF